MFKQHSTFLGPPDQNVKIWRYLDFTKFVSLLHSGSLWFSRADKFEDPLEGSYPRMNIEARKGHPDIPKEYLPYAKTILEGMSAIRKDWPRYITVNCWHINEHESSAMWSIYLKSNEGIAIQSTYNRLKECFSDTDEDVFIGKVNYIDYEHQVIENANLYSPFVYKRKSYEHERELRALIVKPPPLGAKGFDFNIDTITAGINVTVGIQVLIESVYVAPNSPVWFTELVKSVLIKYDCDFPVLQSTLSHTEPLF